MKPDRFLRAALVGLTMTFAAAQGAPAEVLQVMRGEASGALNVPMNRAVVVESQTPFAELSIANPGIADISTLSDRTIYVLGKAPGRTTLTLLGPDGRLITNVEVQVTPDVAEFKERLQQILPNERIDHPPPGAGGLQGPQDLAPGGQRALGKGLEELIELV